MPPARASPQPPGGVRCYIAFVSRLSRVLLPASFVLLLVVAAALVALQVGWVKAASRAEELRLRASLSVGVSRVLRDAEDEIRVLVSLARVSPDELEREDWSAITEGIRFWQDSCRFAELLREAYILPSIDADRGYRYDGGTRSFAAETVPQRVVSVVRSELEPRLDSSSAREAQPEDATGYFVIPVGSPHDGAAPPGGTFSGGAVALRLDRDTLYYRVIPSLVSRHLEGYALRIRTLDSGAVLYEEGEIAERAQPEAALSLSGLWLTDQRWSLSRGGAVDDPSLRYWFLRMREEGEAGSREAEPRRAAGAVLEIYYPRGSISQAVGARRALDVVVGAGLIATLVLSALVLYRLYRRSARLRASEQEFVASMSHELRTPITVIQATSENLRRGVVSEASRVSRYGGVIHEQARRLSGMVESVLFYSGLQSGGSSRPASESVDLGALVEEVLSPLRELALERGRSLALSVEPECRVRTDGSAIRLILENLVMNAVNHAESGEIRVEVSHPARGRLRFVVEDEGAGIPAREQSSVFEPFVRGEKSRRDQVPGSGLGLHLVKRVVSMLGGTVRLESPYFAADGRRLQGCRFEATASVEELGADG